MQGCLREGYDFCPERTDRYNVSVGFCLPDKTGTCVFMDKVTSVNVLLFDADGAYTETRTVGATDLTTFKGVRMNLDPGTYRMVAWANMNGSMMFYDLESGSSSISYTDKTGGRCGNSDPVYYAPSGPRSRALGTANSYHEITVDENGHASEIDFRDAHRTLEVYIQGLESSGTDVPTIKISGLPEGLYVNGMGHIVDGSGNKLTVYSEQSTESKTVDNTRYDAAKFWSLWFEEYADVVITIYDKDGDERYSVPLIDVLDESDPDEVVIRIKIVFKGGSVDVSVPDWNAGDIGIGFWD